MIYVPTALIGALCVVSQPQRIETDMTPTVCPVQNLLKLLVRVSQATQAAFPRIRTILRWTMRHSLAALGC